MFSIKVSRTWLENRTTRNAYYQVFTFLPSVGVGRAATVTHYGSLAGAVVRWHRPVTSGTMQVHRNNVGGSRVSAKQKGDYAVVDTDVRHFSSAGQFQGWLLETFGAAQAHEINQAMFTDEPIEVAETIPKVAATPEVKPTSWASW